MSALRDSASWLNDCVDECVVLNGTFSEHTATELHVYVNSNVNSNIQIHWMFCCSSVIQAECS